MSKDLHRYLVAYDISSDHRRSRVSTVLQSYGYRLQYSLFEIEASPTRIERLLVQLENEISIHEDSVLIYDLGKIASARKRNILQLGALIDPQAEGPIVI